jgi:hypothetical protein
MIVVSTMGQGATRVPQMPLPDEKFLESFVALNPDVLPLQELREDLSLVVLGRQVATLSGPIDVLAVDDQGGLYIVETKLYRNPDKRRVIAQMLDYGAVMIREIGSSLDPIGALFVRSGEQLPRAIAAVTEPGLTYQTLDEHVATTSGRAAVGTMHLAKGLEFKAVAVMACDDEVIPLQSGIESVGDDADLKEVYDTERHLLYVACTRARDYLHVSAVEPASEFLDDLLQEKHVRI